MSFYSPLLLYYSILISFLLNTIQSYHNISMGSSLIAGDDSSSWQSPSGDFAIGFQQLHPGNFLLSIWFNNIAERTIAWSANRDNPVPTGSKLELTPDRGLVLTEPGGIQVWTTAIFSNDSHLSHGAMLDTGSFVLVSQTSEVIWQSFDHPTDTILQSQVLKLGARLTAPYSATNYSSGRFMLWLADDGNLAFYPTNCPQYECTNSQYLSWESQGIGYQVRFNQTGALHLLAKDGSVVGDVFDDYVTGQDYYQRAALQYDGVLIHYVYPKNNQNQSSETAGWSVRSRLPDNICTAFMQETGSGVCSFNSYCKLGNDTKTYCECPPGYGFTHPGDPFSACAQSFAAQSCGDKSDVKHFYMETPIDVDWPLSDYEHYLNVSKDWCRDICLPDCFCAVSVHSDDGDCWKKKLPLSNGRYYSSFVGKTTFLKLRRNNTSFISMPRHHKSNHHKAISVVPVVTIMACLAVYVLRKRRNKEFERMLIIPNYN